MEKRCFTILLSAVWFTLSFSNFSHASTRARFLAETGLYDASARISAGSFHTCQVNEDGTVRCWGFNNEGQLGNGSTTSTPVPVLVSGITNAVAIAAEG